MRTIIALCLLALSGCGLTKEQIKERDFHLGQGELYFTYGRFPQAADQYERALTFDPESYEAHVSLGYCYRAIGWAFGPQGDRWARAEQSFKLAEKHLAVARAVRTDDVRVPMGFGWLYYEWGIAGRKRAAALAVQRDGYAKIYPDRVESYNRLIQETGEASAERLARAEQELEQARVVEPANGFVLQTLALTLAQLGPERYDEAAGHMEQFKKHAIELRLAAEKQVKAGYARMTDRQLQVFKNQIDNLKGLERRARVFLGWIYFAQGTDEQGEPVDEAKLSRATAELKAVLALDPDSANQHLNLAHIYDKAGQRGKAVAELQQYLRKNQLGRLDLTLYTKQWLDRKK